MIMLHSLQVRFTGAQLTPQAATNDSVTRRYRCRVRMDTSMKIAFLFVHLYVCMHVCICIQTSAIGTGDEDEAPTIINKINQVV